MKEGRVYTALKRLTHDLAHESISYVIMGGMALNLWGYARQTVDVDILLTAEGLAKFTDRFVGRGYAPAFSGAVKAFREAETQVKNEQLDDSVQAEYRNRWQLAQYANDETQS